MRERVLMVYPQMGFSGNFAKHIPLSVLYASAELVKHGIDVEVCDLRIEPKSWKATLQARLSPEILAVGISVMSGEPVEHAIDIGRCVKTLDANTAVVWGGPHATFFPETIFQERSCDYVVSGYASESFYQLIQCLLQKKEPSSIPGVYYRKNGRIAHSPYVREFEHISYQDIPYHLVSDYSVYGQLEDEKTIFSLFSVMGCPYHCAFCSSPAFYKDFPKRWIPLPVQEVVDHIEYVVEHYGANYIYFIDDDSFVNLQHVEEIIDEIRHRRIDVGLGFRGARINEIKKMSDEFLNTLAQAGTNMLHVGAESGSNRILELIRKDCTIEDIIECNQKLARHPQIIAAYNFIMGVPTETVEDLKLTRDLMFRLIEDNERCLIIPPNKFRPLPGTELFELAVREWNYTPPARLEDWVQVSVEGDFSESWYPKGMKQFADLMLVTSYFIDNKIQKITIGKTAFYKILRLLNRIYRPIARFRLRHGLYHGLIEYHLYRMTMYIIGKIRA
ncbi:MAG: B12-binding domain-containing radical SAM protein [bacterium]|nr:B12-binding domain-containing radical SAM protein [bacterium]